MSEPALKFIEAAKIRIDGGTQPRAAIDESVVSEYTAAMTEGGQQTFPPVVVFDDGASLWLADGFHRFHASCRVGFPDIWAEAHRGTRRDAVLFGFSANVKHGLRETRADKRRKIETMLHDDEWAQWSDREIGRRCGADHKTVSVVRAELELHAEVPHVETPSLGKFPSENPQIENPSLRNFRSENPQPETRIYTTKHGTPATMQVGNIGRRPQPSTPDAVLSPPPVPVPPQDEPEGRAPSTSVAQPPAAPAAPAANGEIERLRTENAVLLDRVEHLEEAMADYESLARIVESDDQVSAALAEVKRYGELARVMNERVHGLTGEKAEAIRLVKHWRKRAEKAEAQIATGVPQ